MNSEIQILPYATGMKNLRNIWMDYGEPRVRKWNRVIELHSRATKEDIISARNLETLDTVNIRFTYQREIKRLPIQIQFMELSN